MKNDLTSSVCRRAAAGLVIVVVVRSERFGDPPTKKVVYILPFAIG